MRLTANRLTTIKWLIALCALLVGLVFVYSGATAGTPSHAVIVKPTSLTIPVGATQCYQFGTATNPVELDIEVGTNGRYISAYGYSYPTLGRDHESLGWRINGASCVTGVAPVASTLITHTINTASTSSEYGSVTIDSVSVTVTATSTIPTVRFLMADMQVIEGDSSTRDIDIELNIAPVATSPVSLMWYAVPHSTTTSPGMDYVAYNLTQRQITIPAGASKASFKFTVNADTEVEGDETVRIHLLAKTYDPDAKPAEADVTDVAVGETGNFIDLEIINDDDTPPPPSPTPVPKNLSEAAAVYDTNRNDMIEHSEYKWAVSVFREARRDKRRDHQSTRISTTTVAEYSRALTFALTHYDEDGDGRISKPEYKIARTAFLEVRVAYRKNRG